MKNNTRRVFLRNTSLAATGVLLVSPLGATNKKSRNTAALGCAPMSFKSLTGTIASVKSGNWSDAATWGGKVPGNKDVVDISASHTITYDVAQTVIAGLQIAASASLVFDPSKNTVLESSGNIINEGLLKMNPSSQSIKHTLRFISVLENNFVGGGMDVLPTDVGLWVMNNGQLDLQGAQKTSWTKALDTLLNGTSKINLVSAPQGWAAGDQLITTPTAAPNTQGFVSSFDDNQIAAVSGSSVSLNSPLAYTHPKVNSRWTAEVINVTRNVSIEGTPLGRSHIFIRSGKPQTLKYVQLRFMGPRKDINGDKVTELVKGRYALHFHHSMDGSRGTVIEGCVIRDTGNHSYVPHVSHGILFKNNVAYNVTETAFWWDESDISHDIIYDSNIVALCKFVNRSIAILSEFDPGQFPPTFSSSGFLLGRGDDCVAINNVVVGTMGDPHNGGAYNWEANNEGVWKFENNLAHNNDCGIRVWQVTPRHHVIDKFTAYHNGVGIFHGAYANSYKYTGGHLYGNVLEIKAGSTDTNRVRFENMIIDGAGLIDHCVVNGESPLAGAVATLLLNCTILGSKKEAILNENVVGQKGPLVKGLDVVLCNVMGGYAMDSGVSAAEFIRIQNLVGQPLKITSQGQANIASFAPTLWGTGNGLLGTYFNKQDFTNHVFTRTDYNLSFPTWGDELHYKITGWNYSVRWTGQLQPQYSEDHIFKVSSGGAFKLWIDKKLILEATESYPDDYTSKAVKLEAGKKYDIQVDYVNTDSRTGIVVFWKTQSLPEECIPQSQLYAGISTTPAPPPTPVTNQPPVVNAGADLIVTLPIPNGVVLNGTATDPDGSVKSQKWTKVSGPSSVTFSDDTAISPTVTNLDEGVYVFRLTVTDNKDVTGTDDIQVTVNPAKKGNKTFPTANAGADQTITLPVSSVILSGTGSDPDGNAVTYKWTKVSGSSGTLINDTSASASVSSLKAGDYVFRLTVTDVKGTSTSDDVEITVKAPSTQNDNGNGNNNNSGGNDNSGGNNNNSGNNDGSKGNNPEIDFQITAYPNPSPSLFTLKVRSSSNKDININVYNRWGKLVDSFSGVGNNSTITIGSNYKKGIYYAHMEQGGQTKILRLLKLL
jgi:hypothetical protein